MNITDARIHIYMEALQIIETRIVHSDPARDLHGPCVIAAADSTLVIFIQHSEPLTGNEGIRPAWLSSSQDHGRTWVERGPVDPPHRRR